MDEKQNLEEEPLMNFNLNREVANKFRAICKLQGKTIKEKLFEMISEENKKTQITLKKPTEQ